jgi:mannan endo-1,4-beta-mannosidase
MAKNTPAAARGLSALLAGVLFLSGNAWAATADPDASAKTQAVLSYLAGLPNRTTKKVISGQFDGWNGGITNDVQTVFNNTGKWPGIIGLSYTFGNDAAAVNALASQYSASNGLVVMTIHLYNPVTGVLDMSKPVDLAAAVTPGNPVNAGLNADLDVWAAGLSELQKNDVPVIAHMLTEMNGCWFWWSCQNADQFKNLWVYIFDYFTKTKGLHNLLFQYSPANGQGNDMSYYPGDDFVDLVGIDFYGGTDLSGAVSEYDALSALGKPFSLAEFGPCGGANPCDPGSSDYYPLIADIGKNMPKTVYWMSWNTGWGMADQKNVSALLADPMVINRDDMSPSGDPQMGAGTPDHAPLLPGSVKDILSAHTSL